MQFNVLVSCSSSVLITVDKYSSFINCHFLYLSWQWSKAYVWDARTCGVESSDFSATMKWMR